jgi:hypothetical protein
MLECDCKRKHNVIVNMRAVDELTRTILISYPRREKNSQGLNNGDRRTQN